MTTRDQDAALKLLAAWVETHNGTPEERAKLASDTVKFLWLGSDLVLALTAGLKS